MDSMSPMYYIVSGRVRLTENGNISWRDSGMLLGAEVLDIAAGIPSYTHFSLSVSLSHSLTHTRVHTHPCVHVSVPTWVPLFFPGFSCFPYCLQKGSGLSLLSPKGSNQKIFFFHDDHHVCVATCVCVTCLCMCVYVRVCVRVRVWTYVCKCCGRRPPSVHSSHV